MSRVAFPLVLQSPSSGSAIVGATATITEHVVGDTTLGTGAAASIYTQEVGGVAQPTNQIVTDNLGRWTQGSSASYAQYWLPVGTYDIVISGTGLTAYAITRELVSANGLTPAWTAVTPATNWEDGASSGVVSDPYTSSARLVGDMVELCGALVAMAAIEAPTIATLAISVAKQVKILCPYSSNEDGPTFETLLISSTAIELPGGAGDGDVVYLDGLSFRAY